MELISIRKEFGSNYTKSNLLLNGLLECCVLEDADRQRQADGTIIQWTPNLKILGRTAIPYGRYRITIDQSERFKRLMPHILDVPDFTSIRIHRGNTDKDTEGCLLVGSDWGQGDYVGRSKIAFDALYPKLETAFNNKEEIWIEITSGAFEVRI